ncbi:hypothetical protein MMC18_004048 [Xylographa bjoerkii]|nr:hypothetical protein [Xylographa bjoerkii]
MTEIQRPPQAAHELSFAPRELPKLRSNYGNYVDRNTISWLRPTPLSTPLDEMRKRYEADGYLWVKHLIPREDVYDMRELYFSHISPAGILAPSTSPRDGVFNPELDPLKYQGLGGTPLKASQSLLDSIHSHPSYRSFLAHPTLRSFIRTLTGWDKEVMLNRGLLRHNVPQSLSTGIHYDQLFLRAGDPVFITAWVPIGDCSAAGGGLMYLENSCATGEACEKQFEQRQEADEMSQEERLNAFNKHMGEGGHLSHDAEEFLQREGRGRKWLVADYEAGDVVFHSPWMIHGATKNEDESGRIRLATDLRFYEEGAKLDERWMKTFYHGDGL